MAPKSTEKIAGAAAAALASAWYLNDRFGFYADVKGILHARSNRVAIGKKIAQLGQNAGIYHMLELCDPHTEALWFEGRTWTYAELKLDVDKFATILEQHGVVENDAVAVFTTNSPEMVIAFLALNRIGAVAAMINTSLRSQTLAHCMSIAKAKLIVCTPDLVPPVVELFSETSNAIPCLSINLSSFPPLSSSASQITQVRYEDLFAAQPATTPLPVRPVSSQAALIYTSGTSGKPKAVNVKNMLFIVTSTPLVQDTSNRAKYYPLRTYSCLPLYHATCLAVGLSYSIGNSSTFCLARKFSARSFSRDLVACRATRMLYVGELCRYLLRAPPSPDDTAHKVIVAAGNGMAKDVWTKFMHRFAIPEIREFYRSTEGIARFDNFLVGQRGAGNVGYQGVLRTWAEDDTYLVRYDPDTEQPWRDPQTGFCRAVGADEPGEAIGRVRSMATYNEYLDNEKANKDKIIRDVFAKGDVFQRTGDLLVRDRRGWVSFLDRTGDTYRWRGENVAAGEVREHVSRLDLVIDCSVFAVKLLAYDGQAGAVGITLRDPGAGESKADQQEQFMAKLYRRLTRGGLTNWQMPRLVRITERVDTTATFKHAKEVLKKRSWDPVTNADGDSLYWLDGERFVKLDGQSWQAIEAGKARL